MRKKTRFHPAVMDVIRKQQNEIDQNDFSDVAGPLEKPEDNDWHLIITAHNSAIMMDDGFRHKITTMKAEVGFYNGEYWTLGTENGRVKVVAWDRTPRMHNSSGDPLTADGTMKLVEAVVGDACQEYMAAYKAYSRRGDINSISRLNAAEAAIPYYLTPYKKSELLKMLRKRAKSDKKIS